MVAHFGDRRAIHWKFARPIKSPGQSLVGAASQAASFFDVVLDAFARRARSKECAERDAEAKRAGVMLLPKDPTRAASGSLSSAPPRSLCERLGQFGTSHASPTRSLRQRKKPRLKTITKSSEWRLLVLTPRGACGPIAGAAEKGVLGKLEWRPSLSRSGVTADALNHGAHAVRALWRQMLLEAQPAKSAQGVDSENLLRRAIGENRDRDRD
jgi:hypothetical protein